MTDAQLKELAKENNYEPTYELLSFARLALINARALDLAAVAMNIRAAVRQEREECAKVCEAAKDHIWSFHSTEVCEAARNTCDNLAVRIRAREQA